MISIALFGSCDLSDAFWCQTSHYVGHTLAKYGQFLENIVKTRKLGKISFFDTHFLGEDDFPFEENSIFNHIDELTLRKYKSESGYSKVTM